MTHAPASALSVGVAEGNITPDVRMPNWAADNEPYGDVADSLYARCLVLADGEISTAILTLDAISVWSADTLRKTVNRVTGIPENRVIVTASHSHSAPGFGWNPNGDSLFVAWAGDVIETCARIAMAAQETARPVTPSVAHANVGEWLFSRRPTDAEGNVQTVWEPEDRHALPGDLRPGPVYPTLTLLSFDLEDGNPAAMLFSLPCHPVSVYSEIASISSDFPGRTIASVKGRFRCPVVFVQGCSGDIVPARRGLASCDSMAAYFSTKVAAAHSQRRPLPEPELRVADTVVHLPLRDARSERSSTAAEVRGLAIGPFAMVALPGEPLTTLANSIRERSPFLHTLVAGNSNRGGTGYIGLAEDVARGGYEGNAGGGAPEAGLFLAETASRLLERLHNGAMAAAPE